jgi:hypothetical protein
MLPDLQECVFDLAVDQAEIAGILRDVYVGQLV